ncbi:hypothetical protein WJX84_008054 [Apatococcus fuscideae]|uniref:JmjC domain-containing protein n=1 Tax=Apatococcus fuscideae TaxID=2026836 RepID=A0AAW1SQX8_9CHLO
MTQFALPQIDSGISALNVQEVYIQRGLPVVITQLASQWPITAACSLEKLRYTHGGVEVHVTGPNSSTWSKMGLKEYIDGFEEYKKLDSKPYLRTWNFLDDIPELKEMYHSPRHFQDRFQQLPENQRPPFTWLFVGPCGVQTPLHVDIWHTDAWLAQLEGRKRFRLFHPSRRAELVAKGLLADAAEMSSTSPAAGLIRWRLLMMEFH